MELTVLGRNGGFPEPGGACSGYLIQSGGTHVVVDLGSGTLSRLVGLLPLEQLDALILTHLHFDHCSDALVLQYALEALIAQQRRADPLPVYLPDTPEQVRALFDNQKAFALHTIGPETKATLGDFKIAFFETQHPVETYGLRMVDGEGGCLAYTADTGMFDGLAEAVKGADTLLCDTAFFADRDDTVPLPHLTTRQASKLAREANVKQLLCTHLTGGEIGGEKVAREIDFSPAFVVQELGHYKVLHKSK